MQDPEDIIIPEGAMYYACSECDYVNTTYYAVQTHTKNKPECKRVGATVIQKMKSALAPPDIEEKIENAVAAANAPAASPSYSAGSQMGAGHLPQSQAQAAGSASSPAWAGALYDEDEEEDISEYEQAEGYLPAETEVHPLQLRNTMAIAPTARLVVVYEAYQQQGYVGSISQWVHDMIFDHLMMLGIDVVIFDTPPQVRERILAMAGLADR